MWYKADYTGYEGLAEYLISHLLKKSTLAEDEYVLYDLEEIKYKEQIYTGAKSESFLKAGWQLITLERLFKNFFGESLYISILNEDRHTHNIAVLMNEKGEFSYCPIFDNGAGLLSDTMMEYPLQGDVYELMRQSRAKTICADFDEQLDISEGLYGGNMKFNFTEKDVRELLQNVTEYSEEEKRRVEAIICAQISKYRYLMEQ